MGNGWLYGRLRATSRNYVTPQTSRRLQTAAAGPELWRLTCEGSRGCGRTSPLRVGPGAHRPAAHSLTGHTTVSAGRATPPPPLPPLPPPPSGRQSVGRNAAGSQPDYFGSDRDRIMRRLLRYGRCCCRSCAGRMSAGMVVACPVGVRDGRGFGVMWGELGSHWVRRWREVLVVESGEGVQGGGGVLRRRRSRGVPQTSYEKARSGYEVVRWHAGGMMSAAQ